MCQFKTFIIPSTVPKSSGSALIADLEKKGINLDKQIKNLFLNLPPLTETQSVEFVIYRGLLDAYDSSNSAYKQIMAKVANDKNAPPSIYATAHLCGIIASSTINFDVSFIKVMHDRLYMSGISGRFVIYPGTNGKRTLLFFGVDEVTEDDVDGSFAYMRSA